MKRKNFAAVLLAILSTYAGGNTYGDVCSGAAIGGGFKGRCKKISLNGGLVEATGGENYPAIGGGTEEECFCGGIKIYGGDISCYAGKINGFLGISFCDTILLLRRRYVADSRPCRHNLSRKSPKYLRIPQNRRTFASSIRQNDIN